MPIKQRNAITRTDFEEAVDYLGSSVSDVAKETNIPRAYLSDLKNRNVRLRREHEDKLRAFLENEGVEFDDDGDDSPAPPAPAGSPHASVEISLVRLRTIALDERHDDDDIATALDAQADRDARLSQLFATKVEREDGFFGPGDHTEAFKKAVAEARALLAESAIVIGKLRGLRGLKGARSTEEPQTLGELLAKEHAGALEAAGLMGPPAEPAPAPEPAPEKKKSILFV